jgi:hypothetical protein
MNRSIFNFKNMMDMCKSFSYQIYNSSFLKINSKSKT